MKINEHLIFNLTNAVRKCITLNIKAYIRIQVHICVYMYVVPTQYVGNSWPQAAFPKASRFGPEMNLEAPKHFKYEKKWPHCNKPLKKSWHSRPELARKLCSIKLPNSISLCTA